MKKIWLDCDPGHDDMLAIIMAALHQQCQLIGISTSIGNSSIEHTTQNALNIIQEIGRTDIDVYKGSPQPLCRKLQTNPALQQNMGLQGANLQKAKKQAIKTDSFYKMYLKIMNEKQPIQLVITGAMTNIAILMQAFPQIKQKISRITFMGGAINLGNATPAAQFNIFADPQAASIILHSGLPIVMIPIDLTNKVIINQQIFAQLEQMKNEFSKKMIGFFKYLQNEYLKHEGYKYAFAHDPCTIYYLLHPNQFTARKAYVTIELQGKSRGRTNCIFKTQNPNVLICEKMNLKPFWNLMLKLVSKIK